MPVPFNKPVMALLTVMADVAVRLPSTDRRVMVAVPIPVAVTTPLELTDATAGLLLLHIRFWFVAFAGNTVAVRFSVVLGNNCAEDGLTDTDVTGMTVPVTLTTAVLLPSFVVTVTCAVPAPVMVSKPLADTVATAGLLLLQVTF